MKEKFNFKITEDLNHIWFTSDTHFGHKNILGFCSRPFNDIYTHDETLINNWNSVVGKNDLVFHLGDVGFESPGYIRDILSRLNGRIVLIMGNHDWKNLNQSILDLFHSTHQQLYVQINNRKVLMNHVPFLCYGGTYRRYEDRVWQLFGHVHSGPNVTKGRDIPRLDMLFKDCQYDVGVDNNQYRPISFAELEEHFLIYKNYDNSGL